MALENLNRARELLRKLEAQPNKFVFGIEKAVFNCVLALVTPVARDGDLGKEYAQAHVYLLDLPGRGKTAVLKHLSASIDAKLGRVDGRPDMMPSDLAGYEYIDRFTGRRTLLKGPLHSNVLFFDEINRTPSKGQAIMLGAMEGGYVVMNVTNLETGELEARQFFLYPISDASDGRSFFICFATANPIDFEGTYPLSEAHKERFTYSFRMGLPDRKSEKRIRPWNVVDEHVEKVMDLPTLLDIQKAVSRIRLSDQANELIMRIIDNSRPSNQDIEEYDKTRERYTTFDLEWFVNRYVASGCSPRRNYHMVAATQAWAFMRGEYELAGVDDVKAIAPITMEHVILLQPRSEGDGISSQKVVKRIIDTTAVPV